MEITKTPIPATIRPKRMIGEFTADITTEETLTDSLQITTHPVQQGANITDHAYVNPVSITVKTVFGASDLSLSEIYDRLLKLQASRIPIDVVTGRRIYKNMLIKTLSQTITKGNENVLAIDFTLQEIILTSVAIVSVPERAKQKKPKKTSATRKSGKKNLKKEEPETLRDMVIEANKKREGTM